jgi:asparagine synthase (glutamine-hydrolysing)
MANSLEVRVPILDSEIVEWAASLPPRFKLHGREGKYILKKALESRLPEEILYRKKMGFSIPLARWFRGPLRERVRGALLGGVLADTDLFERQRLAELVEQHQRGQRDHGTALWSLLMLEAWFKKLNGAHDGLTPGGMDSSLSRSASAAALRVGDACS